MWELHWRRNHWLGLLGEKKYLCNYHKHSNETARESECPRSHAFYSTCKLNYASFWCCMEKRSFHLRLLVYKRSVQRLRLSKIIQQCNIGFVERCKKHKITFLNLWGRSIISAFIKFCLTKDGAEDQQAAEYEASAAAVDTFCPGTIVIILGAFFFLKKDDKIGD